MGLEGEGGGGETAGEVPVVLGVERRTPGYMVRGGVTKGEIKREDGKKIVGI